MDHNLKTEIVNKIYTYSQFFVTPYLCAVNLHLAAFEMLVKAFLFIITALNAIQLFIKNNRKMIVVVWVNEYLILPIQKRFVKKERHHKTHLPTKKVNQDSGNANVE